MAIRFTSPHALPVEPLIDLVLASQSIGRRMLLDKLSVRFRAIPTRVDEKTIQSADPITMMKKRAEAKARDIATSPAVYGINPNGKALIVAADSMAIIGKRVFGKPTDREHVKAMLKSLTGKTHTFATAVHVIFLQGSEVKKRWEKVQKTRVTMRKLTPVELDSYVARYDLSRFAGAYALNEAPWDLITKIEGSYTNVIGLPFEFLLPVLRKLKIIT